MKRTHLDLFSGIGGFALACRWAGVQTVGFAEIDDYASRVLAKNFPGVTNYGDVRNVPGDISAWLITGGAPCQPNSRIGKRGGSTDDRWLWPEMLGAIERIRSDWVIFENVPGILDMDFDSILSDLERTGYEAITFNIPALAVNAYHKRERIFVVANARSERLERKFQARTAALATGRTDRECAGLDTVPDGMLQRFLVHDPSDARLRVRLPRLGRMGRDGFEPVRIQAASYEAESGICGVAHGIPARVDRLRGLGNAIVPQVAYQLIRMMIEAEESL